MSPPSIPPASAGTCNSCGAAHLRVFYELTAIPVNSVVLVPSPEEARAFPTGDLSLGLCEECGFIQNTRFEPQLVTYTSEYEETQGFSSAFNAFAQDLARRLVDRHDLHHKEILEVGCGKGEFLLLLCELGNNRGVGIDPAYVPGRLSSEALDRIEFIRDFFGDRYTHLAADFLCCRHTLEHIQPTRRFAEHLYKSAINREGAVLFIEVPDTRRVLQELAFWDIYYEHCSYFTAGSLARLFVTSGFNILDVRLDFADQYLLLEALPGDGAADVPASDDVEEIASLVDAFADGISAQLDQTRARVDEWTRSGRTVIWGAGSKGVAFLTTLGIREEIEYAVDVNPFKQGMFMPGTSQPVVGPDFLREFRPETVIVMNPIYIDEIRNALDSLGLKPQVVTL